MAEVIAAKPAILSDSTYRTRPGFRTILMTDSNARGTVVKQIEDKRQKRLMKFPSLIGRKEVESLLKPQQPDNPGFRKYNDEGDHRACAPLRSCDNIVDPVSGFVSVAGDTDRGTGRTRIASMVQLNNTPNTHTPQEIHSVRVGLVGAPEETRRATEDAPGSPSQWRGRKVLDVALRADMGGWTSSKDPKKSESPRSPEQELREKLVHKYLYTSSTQRSYEDVPWDDMVQQKRWAPISTLEDKPDMISQCFTLKRYEPHANEWQSMGRSWDMYQTRKHYHTDFGKEPVPGVVFCSPCPRAQHIPGYSGCVGGENLEEIDNAAETFRPLTVKRVALPRYTDTAHRPNIPRYDGCTLYRPDTAPAHTMQTPPPPQTTARDYPTVPVMPHFTDKRREGPMSKMVTTVPPGNPFNPKPDKLGYEL